MNSLSSYVGLLGLHPAATRRDIYAALGFFAIALLLLIPSAQSEQLSLAAVAIFAVTLLVLFVLTARTPIQIIGPIVGWAIALLLILLVMGSIIFEPAGELSLGYLPNYSYLLLPVLVAALLLRRWSVVAIGLLTCIVISVDYAVQPHAADLVLDTAQYGWLSNLARALSQQVMATLLATLLARRGIPHNTRQREAVVRIRDIGERREAEGQLTPRLVASAATAQQQVAGRFGE